MKRFLSLILAMLLLALPVLAEEADVVYVSITDGAGELVLAYASVPLTDADDDGALTLNDALINAHAAQHPDGAAAYLSEPSQYGVSLVILWGADHGSFGYCVNDASAMSLMDPIQPGDHVKAYAFTDLTAWSDLYTYFEAPAVVAAAGEAVPLTLSANGYDAAWVPVILPVDAAELTVNGERTAVFTDEAGHAVLTFDEAGVYTVSAVSDSQVLVAPVCIVTVK